MTIDREQYLAGLRVIKADLESVIDMGKLCQSVGIPTETIIDIPAIHNKSSMIETAIATRAWVDPVDRRRQRKKMKGWI